MSTTLGVTQQTNINNSSNTTSPDSSTASGSKQKNYSLVKWLENRQFDVQNEWVGRLTSVQHSNIIDFDADELKAGMEISVFRNGEIWRAQVIIPKTASNTIDLPPSCNKSVSKIRTKAMGTTVTTKINEMGESLSSDSSLNNSINNENNQKTFVDLNDFSMEEEKIQPREVNSSSNNNTNNNTTITTSNNNNLTNTVNTNQNQATNLVILTEPISITASAANGSNTSSATAIPNGHHIIITENKLTKDLQILQTAISEAGLNDVYQINQNSPLIIRNNSATHSTASSINNNNNGNSYITLTTPTNNTNLVTVSDMNIETILQMQCELLEQQKELKNIEIETMEQLKLLHQNINRLAKKFDSFENVISNINKITPTNTATTTNTNNNNSNKSPSSQPVKIRRIS